MAPTGSGVGEEGEDAHVRSAVGASEGEDLVDAGDEAGPAGAGGVAGEGGGGVLLEVRGWLVTRSSGRAIFGLGRVGIVAVQGGDPGPEPCVGGENSVNRWRKEVAPICASGPAPGLPRRRTVRMARSRIRSTAPVRAGSWWRNGRIRFGTESTNWRIGSGGRPVVQVGGDLNHSAGAPTPRNASISRGPRLHEGQTPRPLQEKATRRSAAQSSHRMRAKPWARMPQRR
jgi:hypothetical protein